MITDIRIKEDDKYIIFHIEGGLGKNGMATAVIRAIKKQYPNHKLIVVGSWDAFYFNNPNIFRFYLHGEIRYFREFIKDDTIIMKHDPYNETNHILRKEHLTETWCKMFGIKHDGVKPELYLNPRELEIARDKIKPDARPIMLIQSHGGSNQQYSKKSWYRDIPIEIAQKLVNYYSKSYRILHMRLPEQPSLQGTEMVNLPLREMMAVFPLTTKRILIDSSGVHIAAALGLQSTVLWIGNSPKVFGYSENINILPNANIINNFDKFSYLQDDISGFVQAFPYDTVNLFDINKIIEAVNKQK
jgi:ADP-heptose:LPS heptosyltransferase